MPDGYVLRSYAPGDEAGWANVINSVGSLGNYDAERAREFMMGKPQFDPTGLFFATQDGTPVATACAWRDRPEETTVGQLHMVAVSPEHQGRGLGAAVSLAVLRYFEAHGFGTVYLLTDDWRLAAVKTYLNMGFEPLLPEEDHRERWEKLYSTLNMRHSLI